MSTAQDELIAALDEALTMIEQYQAEIRSDLASDRMKGGGFCQGSWFQENYERLARLYEDATGCERPGRALWKDD